MENISTDIFDIKEKGGKIFLIGRDRKDNSRVVIKDTNSFSPYHGEFYIKKDSIDILEEFDNVIDYTPTACDKKSLFGDEVMRVRYMIINFDRVKELRELIEKYRSVIFEGDLWGRTIYCLDQLPHKGYGYSGKWRLGYLDIETTSQFGFPDSNDPKEEVLCFTCYDNYTEKYHFFYWGGEDLTDTEDTIIHQFKTEGEMVAEIVRWLGRMEFDVLTGWNINFDVSYLLQRFIRITPDSSYINDLSPIGANPYYNPKYKQFTILGLTIFDLLESYKRIVRNQLASFKLDNVAEEELGEKKIEVDIKKLSIMLKKDLMSYNKRDVELCVKIDKKVNIFNFFDGLRQFVGCSLDETRFSRSLIDFMILKKARSMNVVLPTASNNLEGRKQFEGAFVDAVQGSYKNVIAFDIAGLYPNIIKTFNLSIECCKDTGTVKLPEITVDISKEGIVPAIVNDLMMLRKHYDAERDKYPAGHPLHEKNDILVESAKLIVDAIYGMCAFPGFRLFKPEIASSITYMGREIIQHTKAFIEARGHKVVVTDTDSSYFTSHCTNMDDVILEGKAMLELVNLEYPRWVQERWGIPYTHCYLKNVFKKVYQRIIVGTKKRYCGHVVWAKGIISDKYEVVGMEQKRSDYSRFARDFQYGLMRLLLADKEDKEISDYIEDKIKQMKLSPPSLIAIPTKIEKELEEYTTNLPKVRGSKYSSEILNEVFGIGDKPLLLFTSGESDIILFYNDTQAQKLLEKVKINWDKMLERNILMTSNMLLESSNKLDIIEQIKLFGSNQKSLFNF